MKHTQISLLVLSVLGLLCSKVNTKLNIKDSDATHLYTFNNKIPIVGVWGADGTIGNTEWGFNYNFGLDLDFGYNIPVHYFYTTQDNVIFNPIIYAEASSRNYIELVFPFMTYSFMVDAIGYKG